MKRNLATLFAIIAWFAVIVQFYLMVENKVSPIPETIIRFFSFFTILTNTLVAIYFSSQIVKGSLSRFFEKPGKLTAITIYILVVGLVYQFVLRQVWDPTGMQKLVDELLHAATPIATLVYWVLYENKKKIHWNQVPFWLIYPGVYLIFILVRGHFSGFYPYPFVNVAEIGYQQALINSLGVLLLFVLLSSVMILVGKSNSK
ncbi:Pr6Pr family membrane protein [Belliella marina]|uniref:Pr6Pr family membrane protein n=1 Tax=Belliella marina TaxID=1644146 RepID=A0ABW4VRK5_9BACT